LLYLFVEIASHEAGSHVFDPFMMNGWCDTPISPGG